MKEAVLRMIDRQKDIEKELEGVKVEYLKLEADVLVNSVQEVAGHLLLSRVYDERPIKELQGLAQQITARNILEVSKHGIRGEGLEHSIWFTRDITEKRKSEDVSIR